MDTYSKLDEILDLFDGKYVGLLSAVTNWRSGTVTELSYTGYGTRPTLLLGSATNTPQAGGRQRANTQMVIFSKNTGTAQTAIAWAIYGAATGGSPERIVPLDSAASSTVVARPDTEDFYAPAHGFMAGQRVRLMPSASGALPGGLSMDTTYFVISTGLTTDSFRLSETEGGSAANVTSWGSALAIPFTPVEIGFDVTPKFDVGALVIRQF